MILTYLLLVWITHCVFSKWLFFFYTSSRRVTVTFYARLSAFFFSDSEGCSLTFKWTHLWSAETSTRFTSLSSILYLSVTVWEYFIRVLNLFNNLYLFFLISFFFFFNKPGHIQDAAIDFKIDELELKTWWSGWAWANSDI